MHYVPFPGTYVKTNGIGIGIFTHWNVRTLNALVKITFKNGIEVN